MHLRASTFTVVVAWREDKLPLAACARQWGEVRA